MGIMVTVEISDRLYKYIQEQAEPFVDTPDSVLIRLLGLDDPHPSTEEGFLNFLIKAELIEVEDELRWTRKQKGVEYSATVGPGGTIVLDDGSIALSPSGAASAVAGGNHPGWAVWTHVRSGRTLDELRSQFRSPGEKQITDGEEWERTVRQVLSLLPKGAWTSYGDLAQLVDRHPRGLGHYFGSTKIPNAHRVLQHNGRVAPSFRWIGEDRGDVHKVLLEDGIRFTSGVVADPAQRLHLEDLRRLLQS